MQLRERRSHAPTKPRFWRLGERIRRQRLIRQMDTVDLAKATDYSPGHWWRIESGHTLPKPERLAKIAEVLGISVEELVSAAEEQEPVVQAAGAEDLAGPVDPQVKNLLRFLVEQTDDTRRCIIAVSHLIAATDPAGQKAAVAAVAMSVSGAAMSVSGAAR